jgi:hypothetical protein
MAQAEEPICQPPDVVSVVSDTPPLPRIDVGSREECPAAPSLVLGAVMAAADGEEGDGPEAGVTGVEGKEGVGSPGYVGPVVGAAPGGGGATSAAAEVPAAPAPTESLPRGGRLTATAPPLPHGDTLPGFLVPPAGPAPTASAGDPESLPPPAVPAPGTPTVPLGPEAPLG